MKSSFCPQANDSWSSPVRSSQTIHAPSFDHSPQRRGNTNRFTTTWSSFGRFVTRDAYPEE